LKKIKWALLAVVVFVLLAACTKTAGQPEEQGNDDKKNQKTEQSASEAPAGEKIIQDDLIVHYIDVGQGDATLLEFEGFTVLIDTGNWNSAEAVDYLSM